MPRGEQAGQGLKADFIMALRFFSRLPSGNSPHQKPELGRIAMALPLASVVIGAAPALLLLGATALGLPPYVAAVLAVALGVVVGGAMAEDALADAADGLFGGHTPERRLEIMKDSRHGTFGVAALCLLLVLRVAALGEVAANSPLAGAAIWLAAGIVSRLGGLWLAAALPPARAEGASASAGRLPRRNFAFGAVMAAVLLVVLAGPATSYAGLAVVALVILCIIAGWTALCRAKVGGQTGDLIGALIALIEAGALTSLVYFAS